MAHLFLTPEDVALLPKDPREAWAITVDKVLQYVYRNTVDPKGLNIRDEGLRKDALEFIDQLAENLEIQTPTPSRTNGLKEILRRYQKEADKLHYELLVDRIAQTVKGAAASNEGEVLLSSSSVVRILHLSAQLRKEVESGDIQEEKKRKLVSLLSEFDRLAESKHASATRLLTTLALVAAGIAGLTSTLADAPSAVETVGRIAAALGQEIESEEELKRLTVERELLRLPAPQPEEDIVQEGTK